MMRASDNIQDLVGIDIEYLLGKNGEILFKFYSGNLLSCQLSLNDVTITLV